QLCCISPPPPEAKHAHPRCWLWPGTITVDLATLVPEGQVTGLENVADVLEKARATAAERSVKNVQFVVGDALKLDFPDGTFDVVHSHQVLQHVGEPVQVLREMRRVTKPGGLVAARNADVSAMAWYPEVEGMEEWRELYGRVARGNGGEPDAGRRLHVWAKQAGFDKENITVSTANMVEFAMADRLLTSNFATTAIDRGHATQEDLQRVSKAWRDWGAQEDGWFCVLNGYEVTSELVDLGKASGDLQPYFIWLLKALRLQIRGASYDAANGPRIKTMVRYQSSHLVLDMTTEQKDAKYTHGHHASVVRSHAWRTAENSAGYLIPHLKPTMHILDIGCGPGTITLDLAALVPEGHVTGLEYVPEVLEQARANATERGVHNVEFVTGNALQLAFPDASFDVVHAHQVLMHLGDPVQALREMRRVVKPGGLVAVREGTSPRWRVRRGLWAGITSTAGNWCFSDPEDRAEWSGVWADRVVNSSFGKMAISGGHATQEDLEGWAKAWRQWGTEENGWFACLHGEILCRV
ncbi:putative methyltransferase C1B3.06c, partial [Grifola frondosa]